MKSISSLILIASLANADLVEGDDSVVDLASFPGGANSVGRELELDDTLSEIETWSKWTNFKGSLVDKYGFDFGFDYATLYQHADSVVTGGHDAFGGAFRLYGKWTVLGRGTRDTGKLVWKIEHRHGIGGSRPPASIRDNIGYAGLTATGFSDVGFFVAPFYWEQVFRRNDYSLTFVAGRIDPTDFVDLSGYGSQWTSFQNSSILSSSAVSFPDLGFAAGVGITLNDQWAFGASIHDANGAQDEYEFFGGGSEFFSQAFVSWAPSRKERFSREVHLTAWHVDQRSDLGIPDGWGIAGGANWLIDDTWMPFLRLAWSDGQAARAKESVVLGLTYRPSGAPGELGLAWNWENLSNDDLGSQQVIEAYFRWDINPSFAVTPSLQILLDPALNPDSDTVVLGGLRARMKF